MKWDFWFDQSKWPRDPDGFLFLGRTVHEIGRHLFPGEWTERETIAKVERPLPDELPRGFSDQLRGYNVLREHRRDIKLDSIPRAGPTFIPRVPITAEQWKIASAISKKLWSENAPLVARFMEVQRAIVAATAAGKLACAYRAIAGGALREIPPVWWNTERNYNRFERCQINPTDPFSIAFAGDAFCWIFVQRESLDRFMAKPVPPPPTANGVHLSPYLQLMLAVARDLDIRPGNQPKKVAVVAALLAKWPASIPTSSKLAEAMATALREPDSQLGKAKKSPDKAPKGGPHLAK